MAGPYASRVISITVSLIAAAAVPVGLRPPLYVAQETATPISGDLTVVTSATDVADLLAASQISAQAAVDLAAPFLQARPPAQVYVATYDHDAGSPETPDDALDRALLAGTRFCPIAQESRADADNEAVANWTLAYPYRYMPIAQTDDAGILTSGKPSGLADCELGWSVLGWHSADAQPLAAAIAGLVGGANLADRGTKSSAKLAMHSYVRGVTLPTLTNAELVFAKANDAATLTAVAEGASSTERIIEQVRTYGGESFTTVVSMMYAIDLCEAALIALVSRYAALGEPILTGPSGEAAVQGALVGALAPMAANGHFRVGTDANGLSLPKGFRVVVTSVGTTISAAVTMLFANEAEAITLALTGEVA